MLTSGKSGRYESSAEMATHSILHKRQTSTSEALPAASHDHDREAAQARTASQRAGNGETAKEDTIDEDLDWCALPEGKEISKNATSAWGFAGEQHNDAEEDPWAAFGTAKSEKQKKKKKKGKLGAAIDQASVRSMKRTTRE